MEFFFSKKNTQKIQKIVSALVKNVNLFWGKTIWDDESIA